MKILSILTKSYCGGALFHIKTRVSLKYFVNGCCNTKRICVCMHVIPIGIGFESISVYLIDQSGNLYESLNCELLNNLQICFTNIKTI